MIHHINCDICGTTWECVKWYGGPCPKCGQRYEWGESYTIELTPTQIAALRKLAEANPESTIK